MDRILILKKAEAHLCNLETMEYQQTFLELERRHKWIWKGTKFWRDFQVCIIIPKIVGLS